MDWKGNAFVIMGYIYTKRLICHSKLNYVLGKGSAFEKELIANQQDYFMFCVTSLGFDTLCEESSYYYNNLCKAYMVASYVGRILNVKIIHRGGEVIVNSHSRLFFAAAEGSFATFFIK